jgi:hypothetical protein
MDADVKSVIRLNRPAVVEAIGWDNYQLLMRDQIAAEDVFLPDGASVLIPNTSIGSFFYDNILLPFGEVRDVHTMVESFVPSSLRNIMYALNIGSLATDPYYTDGDPGGLGALLPQASRTSLANNITEAFMYLESSEGLITETLPLFARIKELETTGTSADQAEYADLKVQATELEDYIWERVLDIAGGTMLLRHTMGFFMPSTPRFIRNEHEQLARYYGSREFAEDLTFGGEGKMEVPVVRSIEDIDQFYDLLHEWISDPSSDGVRRYVREQMPELLVYLQPKTYWADGGIAPEVDGFDEFMEAIARGDRLPVPMGVLVARYQNAAIDSDFWTQFIGQFGEDPAEAASTVLWNYPVYRDLQDTRYAMKDAMAVRDDMHGGEYAKWIERNDDEFSLVERQLNDLRNLEDTIQLMQDMVPDPLMDPEEQRELTSSLKAANAWVRNKITELRAEQEEEEWTRNPYQNALNSYWDEINGPYFEELSVYWDQINDSVDSQERALLHMHRKQFQDMWSDTMQVLPGTNEVVPTPQELAWLRRDPEERLARVRKNATLPIDFLDLDTVKQIEEMSGVRGYLPDSRDKMDIYHQYTQMRTEIRNMWRSNEITDTQRTKLNKRVDEQLEQYLIANSREGEVIYRNMWPIERLYALNMLPYELEQYMEPVRYVKEALRAAGKGPTSQLGRKLTHPIYADILHQAQTDPHFRNVLVQLGLDIYDNDSITSFIPQLFVDDNFGW